MTELPEDLKKLIEHLIRTRRISLSADDSTSICIGFGRLIERIDEIVDWYESQDDQI